MEICVNLNEVFYYDYDYNHIIENNCKFKIEEFYHLVNVYKSPNDKIDSIYSMQFIFDMLCKSNDVDILFFYLNMGYNNDVSYIRNNNSYVYIETTYNYYDTINYIIKEILKYMDRNTLYEIYEDYLISDSLKKEDIIFKNNVLIIKRRFKIENLLKSSR